MVPTRRFWWLAVLGIPLAGVVAELGFPAWMVAYDLLLLVVAFATSRLAPSVKGLRLSRVFDSVLSVRTANKIVVRLENDGVEPVIGRMRDEPPPQYFADQREFNVHVQPGRVQEFVYHLTPDERGSEMFYGTFLRLACPLGLVERAIKLNTEEAIRVYPNVLALREFDLLRQQGRLRELGIRRSRNRGLGSDFESLRDYTEGDDYRKIDWKASARRAKLVVRQYEQERNQCVILAIDVGRHMLSEVNGVRKLDHVLDAILMLAHAAAAAGDMVGLLVYGDTVKRYIPPKKGRAQIGAVIEACHDLVAEPVESDPNTAFAYLSARWKRRSLLVSFTDYEDEDRARDLATALASVSHRHLTLLTRVMDPRIDELLTAPLVDTSAMYQRGAATMITADRRKATALITSARIRTLDAEPQDLAAKLVSYYFMVKERSLL